MAIQLTIKDIEILKESLRYLILRVEESKNHTHETYPQKREKINEFEELKSKLAELTKEMNK